MKITKKQYGVFKRAVTMWVNSLGLKDWELYVGQETMPDSVMATCQWDTPNRVAYINMASDWDNDSVPLTNLEIKATAFHEVFHLAFAEIYDAALDRSLTKEQLGVLFHAQIKRWQNMFVKRKLIRP